MNRYTQRVLFYRIFNTQYNRFTLHTEIFQSRLECQQFFLKNIGDPDNLKYLEPRLIGEIFTCTY